MSRLCTSVLVLWFVLCVAYGLGIVVGYLIGAF